MYTLIVTPVNTYIIHCTHSHIYVHSLLAQHSYTYTIHTSTATCPSTITFTPMYNSQAYSHTLTHAPLIHTLTHTCVLNTLRRRREGPTNWLSTVPPHSMPIIWCRAWILPPHLQMDSDQTAPTCGHLAPTCHPHSILEFLCHHQNRLSGSQCDSTAMKN